MFFTCGICSAQDYHPGETYYDSTGFVRYMAGDLPIVLSAPHGGYLRPDSIPDRDCSGCVYAQDQFTLDITEDMYDAFFEQTGCYPHVIINELHRIKFDANRDIAEAADGNPLVEKAWRAYHRFIDQAKDDISLDYDRGLFLDIHGHAHTIQRIELGYLLSGDELRLTDEKLNAPEMILESSIRSLVGDNIQNLLHAQLLRGDDSFGTLMDNRSFPSVPSASDRFPESGEPYFSGGYNTARHGSRDNAGSIDAIQVELNRDIRTDTDRRAMLVDSLTATSNDYIDLHYDDSYHDVYCSALLPVELLSFTVHDLKNYIRLRWSTSSEINHSHFVIEKSTDLNDFKTIGIVHSPVSSNAANTYYFNDYHVQSSLNYYRLRQVDKDGTSSYSKVLSISRSVESKEPYIFPNPSKGIQTFIHYYSEYDQSIALGIKNTSGECIYAKTIEVSQGRNIIPISEKNFIEKNYFVSITSSSNRWVMKLMVE